MRVRKQGNKMVPCSHPGCAKTLREGTWTYPTGLCLNHQPKVDPKSQREGVRRVTVHLTPGCSTLSAAHQVTLPAFPWEVA